MTDEKEKRKELMRQIKDEVVALKKSPLYTYRTENNYFPVIGEGSHTAPVVFIGEAPGRNEAQTGRPFCGAAGKILDELLASINIKREDVYITNIVKDRPQNNRDPLPEEIEVYGPFLDRQLEIIKPQIIATLGRYSMHYILQKFVIKDSSELGSISSLHGRVLEGEGSFGKITIIPLYHPAAAIYTRSLLDTLKEDFKVLKTSLAK